MPIHYLPESYFVCTKCGFHHHIYPNVPILCCQIVTFFTPSPRVEEPHVQLVHPSRLSFSDEKVWSTYPEALVGADAAGDDAPERAFQPEADEPGPADPAD